jgi:hypothetical protein
VTDGPDDALPRWRDAAWQGAALEWVTAALADRGTTPTGTVEQVKARPWSTVFRVATDGGDVWFKANASGPSHEAALLTALAEWVPDRVLAPLAVDTARGWLLLPDGGPTLRDVRPDGAQLDDWERLLAEYAALQRAVEDRAADLLGIGVPDLRLHRLPAVRVALLADDVAVGIGRPDGLTGPQREDLQAQADDFADLCERAAAVDIPATVQHDDLHTGNVFAPVDEASPYVVFDWGDTSLAHPFATLYVSLAVLRAELDLGPAAPEVARVRDAYLEAWTDRHDLATLRAACDAVLRVTNVARADTWARALQEATSAGLERWGDAVAHHLTEDADG